MSLLGLGLVGGILAGLLGIGAGSVYVPAMLMMGVYQITAQGVSLMVIIPTASVSSYLYYRSGNLDLKIAMWVVPTACLGVLLGGWSASLLPVLILRKAFGVLLLLIGFKLLAK